MNGSRPHRDWTPNEERRGGSAAGSASILRVCETLARGKLLRTGQTRVLWWRRPGLTGTCCVIGTTARCRPCKGWKRPATSEPVAWAWATVARRWSGRRIVSPRQRLSWRGEADDVADCVVCDGAGGRGDRDGLQLFRKQLPPAVVYGVSLPCLSRLVRIGSGVRSGVHARLRAVLRLWHGRV